MTRRRRFVTGLVFAPAIIRTPGLLMPIRSLTPVADWIERQWVSCGELNDVNLHVERPLFFRLARKLRPNLTGVLYFSDDAWKDAARRKISIITYEPDLEMRFKYDREGRPL